MKTKLLILLFTTAASTSAADRPAPPSGVFSCNGETQIQIRGGSPLTLKGSYSGVLNFPVGKKPKFSLNTAYPKYVAKGVYDWADEKYWDIFHISLYPATPVQAYQKSALATCKAFGWKCSTASTYLRFISSLKIVDDSHIDLSILNVTKVRAVTDSGPTTLELWTRSKAPCIKN